MAHQVFQLSLLLRLFGISVSCIDKLIGCDSGLLCMDISISGSSGSITSIAACSSSSSSSYSTSSSSLCMPANRLSKREAFLANLHLCRPRCLLYRSFVPLLKLLRCSDQTHQAHVWQLLQCHIELIYNLFNLIHIKLTLQIFQYWNSIS